MGEVLNLKNSSLRKKNASYLFKFLLLANICMYLEAGAVPAMLLQIANSFGMSSGQQGLLGGVVYFSLGFAGAFSGYLFKHFDHRFVVGSAIGINNILTLIWALTPVDYWFSALVFIGIRFFMGLSQCVLCVFLPLWTNEFAPSEKRTSWMSYLQAIVFLFPEALTVMFILVGFNTCRRCLRLCHLLCGNDFFKQ